MSRSIAIVAPSPVPFQVGGAEKFCLGLREALGALPNTFVDIVKLPTPEATFAEIISSYQSFYNLDLTHFDMVVSVKYPAWMIRHPNHVVYMLHTLRGFYDSWHFNGISDKLPPLPWSWRRLEKLLGEEKPGPECLPQLFDLCQEILEKKAPSSLLNMPGPLIRKIVHFMDRAALSSENIRSWMAISRTVRDRKDYFPADAPVKVLYPPSDMRDFPCAKGEYIFTCSRLNGPKRVDLLVRAMRYVREPIHLKIAGIGPDMEKLKRLAADDERIEFLGYLPDEELPKMYAGALFVPYVPYNEDYGLVTVEAMNCGKPVLTCSDSGGVCEFVEDGVTGIVAEPTPESLGMSMQRLAADSDLCAAMGRRAREKTRHITWDKMAVDFLEYAEISVLEKLPQVKERILVCSDTMPKRDGAGGERRLYHMCANLAHINEVTVLTMGGRNQRVLECRALCDRVTHIVFPWPDNLGGEAELWRNRHGYCVDDVQIMEWCASDAFLRKVFFKAVEHAKCVVLYNPSLYPLVRECAPNLPLVYDSDVNADLKRDILPEADTLIAMVQSVEGDICGHASMLWSCSEDDMKRFTELYGVKASRMVLAPNGCDMTEIRFMDRRERRALRKKLPYSREKLAIFIGSGHGPNVEAARAIIDMAPQVPEAQFLIVGTVCLQPEISSLPLPPNAHMLGPVSDAVKKNLLMRADLGLNPMVSGSGSNLKIIEYLACGLQCVSTPFGMRGQPEAWGQAVRIGSLGDFPRLIREMLANPIPEDAMRNIATHVAAKSAWRQCFAPACEKLAVLLTDGCESDSPC